MLNGKTPEGEAIIRKMAQDTMRSNKTGFYSSAQQSALASRPRKPRKPHARNDYVKAALERGFTLEFKETGDKVKIEPSECKNITLVIDKLMLHPSMAKNRASWDLCKNKAKAYPVSALTQILTGYVTQKTGKQLYSFMGWKFLGINID